MISYNGFKFDDIGAVSLTISRQPDPPNTALPERLLANYTVTIQIFNPSSAETWERVRRAQKAVEAPEAILQIVDERETAVSQRVRYDSDNIPDVIARRKTTLEIRFRASLPADHKLHGRFSATFTPKGRPLIPLHFIRQWKESVSTERPHPDRPTRGRTTVSITFSAVYDLAPLGDSPKDRRDYLTEQLVVLKQRLLEAREGRLVYGEFAQDVFLESATPSIDDEALRITVDFQCRYSVYANASYAVADYTASRREDCESGSEILTVAGTVEAATRAAAETKLAAIRKAHQTGSNRQIRDEVTDRWAESPDTQSADWISLTFSFEWAGQKSGFIGYTLDITTERDAESGKSTRRYGGTVKAETQHAALAAMEQIAAGKETVLLRSSETMRTGTDCNGAAKFFELSFEYLYQVSPGDKFIGGTVTTERSWPEFGDETVTISGSIVAQDENTAAARAHLYLADFQTTALVIRERDESPRVKLGEDGETFTEFTFRYRALAARSNEAAFQYEVSHDPDYERFVEVVTYSGICWARAEADAESAIRQLTSVVTNESGEPVKPKRFTLTRSYEKTSLKPNPAFLAMRFNAVFERNIQGEPGHDLLEAQWTLDVTPQIARASLTEVLGVENNPVAQENLCLTIGVLRAAGRVRARRELTARRWAFSKQGFASTLALLGKPQIRGYQLEPPNLSLTNTYPPYDGENAQHYEYTFSFSYGFNQGMRQDEIWRP